MDMFIKLGEFSDEWEKSYYAEGIHWPNDPTYHTHRIHVEGDTQKNDHLGPKNPNEIPHGPNSNWHRSNDHLIPEERPE